MGTILRFIGISIAVLAALLISAALALWLLFDPNDYKGYVSDQVSSRTGRTFVIEGDLELTFFPWLGVQADRMRLGNAPGYGDEDFASIRRATARVRLLPLLRRQIEFGTIELEGLELNLSRDAQGGSNWADVFAGGPQEETSGETAAGQGLALQGLNIAGIDIRDGRLFWREETDQVRYVLSDLSLRTGPIVMGEPIDARLGIELVGVEPQFTARIDGRTTARIELDAARYSAQRLELEFHLEDGRHEERAAGTLRSDLIISTRDGTVQLIETQVEADLTGPPYGPEELAFEATWAEGLLDLNEQTLRFRELTTSAEDVVAVWEATGQSLLDDPELTGSVRISQGSLSSALEALEMTLGSADGATLGSFDLAAAFAFRPSAGTLTLSGVSGSALGMRFSGELATDETGGLSGRIDVPAFDPGRVFAVLAPDDTGGIDTSTIDRLALSTRFALSPANDMLSLRDVNAQLLGTTLTGEVDRLADGRRYQGTLATAEVDPERFVAVFERLLPEGLGPQQLGALRLSTRFDYDSAGDRVELGDIDAQVIGIRAGGSLSITDVSGSPRTAGSLRTREFSPRTLFGRFDQPIPVTADETVLRRAVVETRLDVDGERGRFENIRLQLDDSTITGELTVEDFTNPGYVFALGIDRVDVDRYLPPAAETADADTAGAGDLDLPSQALRDLALQGRVSVGDMKLANLRFADVVTELSVGDGLGTIESARAKLYGGEFAGDLKLDTLGNEPALSISGRATAIQVDPLMTALRGESSLAGTGTFDLALTGTGVTMSQALRSAGGHIDFALRDGLIRGFDLGYVLCSTYSARQQLPRPARRESNTTAYQLLRGSAQVSAGIARTRDLEATTPFMGVAGQGQLDLATREVNYDVVATLTGSTGIAGCEPMDSQIGKSIPVKVTGPVTGPTVLPDWGELLKRKIEDELRDRLLERLQPRTRSN